MCVLFTRLYKIEVLLCEFLVETVLYIIVYLRILLLVFLHFETVLTLHCSVLADLVWGNKHAPPAKRLQWIIWLKNMTLLRQIELLRHHTSSMEIYYVYLLHSRCSPWLL